MKKQYVKPTTTTVKVAGGNALMAASVKPHLNGSIEGEQQGNFGIDVMWAGSSKNDKQQKDDQGRLWVD